MTTSGICVIGSLNMDVVVRAPRIPMNGETIAGTEFHLVPGGKGANQAIATSRSGASVKMVGCVGDDEFGRLLINSLSTSNVDLSGLQSISKASTGTSVIIVDERGENRIIIVPGANSLLTPEVIEAQWDSISDSSMILMQHEIPLHTVNMVVKKAQKDNIPIILNPAPAHTIPLEVLKGVEILILNETEGEFLSGIKITDQEKALKAAKRMISLGASAVVITLGSNGSVYLDEKQQYIQPAFKVNVIDSTAAGDTFIGGFAASLMKKKSISDAIKYASAAAALAVTQLGAQLSIPEYQKVEQLLADEKAGI